MKKINLILLLLFSFFMFGQNDNNQKNKKNSISIEFYKPIEKSFNEFENFDYGFGASIVGVNNYSKKGVSNSFGVSYERISNNNIVFRPRIGISIIRNNEEQFSEDPNQTKYFSEYSYKQNNFNIFIGIAKRIDLTKKISLDLGLDLASIYYSKGKGNYSRTQIQVDTNTGDIYKNGTNIISEVGSLHSFGIGPYIKPEVNLFHNFTLSFEMQVYFLRTISNDQSYLTEIGDRYLNDENYDHVESKRIVNNNSKIWEWTKVSPLLRLGYKF